MKEKQANTPGMKLCRHCQSEIPQTAKVCPYCRKKQGRKGLIILLVIVVLLIIIFAAALGGGGGTTSQTDESGSPAAASQGQSADASQNQPKEMTEKEYKKACKKVTYENLARNPEKFTGKKVRLTGQIMQVNEDGDQAVYLMQVTKDEYGLWENIVWVNAEVESNNRFLEDDIVNIWGEYQGIREYQTVLSAKNSVPEINAKYLSLKKEKS